MLVQNFHVFAVEVTESSHTP